MKHDPSRDMAISKKILREIDDINDFLYEVAPEDFLTDGKTQKAVTLSLLIIGELAKSYTAEFTEQHPEIPWKRVVGLRNIAAHKYEILDMTMVWDTVKLSLPELETVLKKIGS